MFAAVDLKNGKPPCVVRWTGKQGILSVVTKTWCGEEMDAGDGVLQLPDEAPCCGDCKAAIDGFKLTLAQRKKNNGG